MPGLVSDATRIWELDVFWPQGSQCGVWDTKGRKVDVWECVRAHNATPGTEPPNNHYWRFVTRR